MVPRAQMGLKIDFHCFTQKTLLEFGNLDPQDYSQAYYALQ